MKLTDYERASAASGASSFEFNPRLTGGGGV